MESRKLGNLGNFSNTSNFDSSSNFFENLIERGWNVDFFVTCHMWQVTFHWNSSNGSEDMKIISFNVNYFLQFLVVSFFYISCEFYEIFINTFFSEHLPVTTSLHLLALSFWKWVLYTCLLFTYFSNTSYALYWECII